MFTGLHNSLTATQRQEDEAKVSRLGQPPEEQRGGSTAIEKLKEVVSGDSIGATLNLRHCSHTYSGFQDHSRKHRKVGEVRPQTATYRRGHMHTAVGKWEDPGTDRTVKLNVLQSTV